MSKKKYIDYDKLLEERYRLGLDEMSRISKVNAFNHFIDTMPLADVEEVRHSKWERRIVEKNGVAETKSVCSDCPHCCEEHYNETGWRLTSALDKEWNRSRKLISVVRHNGRYFIGFGLTTDKAKQAAVDEANDFCGEDYTIEDYIKNYGEVGFEVLEWRANCGYELDID